MLAGGAGAGPPGCRSPRERCRPAGLPQGSERSERAAARGAGRPGGTPGAPAPGNGADRLDSILAPRMNVHELAIATEGLDETAFLTRHAVPALVFLTETVRLEDTPAHDTV